jgi:Na+/proline symporter
MVDQNPLSGVGGRDQRRLFLSTARATLPEKRVALAIAAIALVAFLAMASFLLVTLIVESAQIYANALGAAASAEQRLAQFEHARRPLEVRNVKWHATSPSNHLF